MQQLRFICFGLIAIALTACQPPAAQPLRGMDFSELRPVTLNVQNILTFQEYTSTPRPPYVEQSFPTPPAQAVEIWANQRFRAAGQRNRLELIVKQASVVEVPLAQTKGIKGLFTTEQSERYDAHLEVELRLYTGGHVAAAEVSAEAKLSRSISEKATLAERERFYQQLVKDLVLLLDNEVEKKINLYFSPYFAALPSARQHG